MVSTKIADLDSSVLNSPDPLCFLPHELASQLLIVRYIAVGTLSVFIWELLNNILNDYKLLSEYRVRLPTATYFISRVCCLGFIISSTVFETTPIPTCYGLQKTMDVFYSITVVSTSLLFFFRIRAVFDMNPWISAFFAALWVAVLAGCLAFVAGLNAVHIESTQYCISSEVKPFAAAASVIPLINDTLVFLAMSWRLCRNSYACRTFRHDFRIFFFGDYLPVFSKAMLQDGQAYYLTTVTLNLVTVIMLYNHSIPGILRTITTIPNVALMNIMACQVFRNTIFGTFREKQISTTTLSRVEACSSA
ncbi:hypothetical protein BYT27DRAFT_7096258 [Phlegmacium glaucopus]|nr:hypothetical protein BYT27DRAFT_7096258 [Phlegmacium glaucopus]